MVKAVHTLDNRARFKVVGLRGSKSLQAHLDRKLPAKKEILHTSASHSTGNVLVHFKRGEALGHVAAIIEEAIAEFNKCGQRERTNDDSSRSSRRKRTILSSMSSRSGHFSGGKTNGRPSVQEMEGTFWHRMPSDSVLAHFQSSESFGLTDLAAKHNLERYGMNLMSEPRGRSEYDIFFEQFRSLPVTLVGTAGMFSLLSGAVIDALVIFSVLIANGGIGAIAESRAERAIRSTRRPVRLRARVIREGKPREIAGETVAPGDLLVLKPQTYVIADARLIQAMHLSVDESALTGECMPVTKIAAAIDKENVPLADRRNMIYRGALVTGGNGLGIVVATGKNTEFGKMHTLFGSVFPPEPAVARQLKRVSIQMSAAGGIAAAVGLGVASLRGYTLFKILKISLSLFLRAFPEGLTTLAGAALALGVRDMNRHRVSVRHLRALSNLGSIGTVCFDKTGTLTLNKMSIVRIHAGSRVFRVKHNDLFIGEEPFDIRSSSELMWLMQVAVLCSEAEISKQNDGVSVIGSSTERALIEMARRSGIDTVRLRSEHRMLDINDRSEEHLFMSTLHEFSEEKRLIGIKGSPMEILDMCRWKLQDGEKVLLNEEERQRIEIENARMAGDALRVLGFAYDMRDKQDIKGGADDREDLVWLGLVGMKDPLRKEAGEMVAALHEAGIRTTIITGDQSATAFSVGKELNVSKARPLRVLDSTQLTSISSEAMEAIAGRVHVFARVNPSQKVAIVHAYQSANRTVAMVGDGINDAPALKASDVGITMGVSGTDLAREAGDVILEDDDLGKIVIAIRDGRAIYENMHKAVRFLMTASQSDAILKLTSLAAGVPLHSNPLNAIARNILCLTLTVDSPDPGIMKRPPLSPDRTLMDVSNFKETVEDSMTITAGAIAAGGLGAAKYGTGSRAGGLALQSLAAGQFLYALTCRGNRDSMNPVGRSLPNPHLKTALWGSFALQGLPAVIPGLRAILGPAPVSFTDILIIGGSALLTFALNQARRPQGREEEKPGVWEVA